MSAPTKALTEVSCPNCHHRGFVPCSALGRVLRCHDCNHAHMVMRKGNKRLVRSRYVEEDESLPTMPAGAVDDSYSAAPAPRRRSRPRKRVLMPRVPVAV